MGGELMHRLAFYKLMRLSESLPEGRCILIDPPRGTMTIPVAMIDGEAWLLVAGRGLCQMTPGEMMTVLGCHRVDMADYTITEASTEQVRQAPLT